MAAWIEPDTPATVHHPASDADWTALRERYGATEASPFARVLDVAREHRCRTVIEEHRYVDPDYRSEYSAFWSERFATAPAFARRLHFFRRTVTSEQLHRIPATTSGYVGYSVLKPIIAGRVGRTVLAPPPRLRGARLTVETDRISLFGTPLEVTGSPFCEQDGEYLRCAHAAAWMCHYYAHLRGLVGRKVTSALVELSPQTLSRERPLPSKGLNPLQMQAIFGATGQPALFYGLSRMPSVQGVDDPMTVIDDFGRPLHPGRWDTRMFSVVCRYLNSGFPVLIITHNHAFVAVGWFREDGEIRFVACDDQWGPYETIQSPFTDRRGPWEGFMIPLPPKAYFTGESAESLAHFLLRAWGANPDAPEPWRETAEAVRRGAVSLRTFLRSNLGYKEAISGQRRGDAVTRVLRLARLPHWIWIVEAHHRGARQRRQRSVIAELVFDSTAKDSAAALLAVSLPGMTRTFPPDGGNGDFATRPLTRWGSQLPPI